MSTAGPSRVVTYIVISMHKHSSRIRSGLLYWLIIFFKRFTLNPSTLKHDVGASSADIGSYRLPYRFTRVAFSANVDACIIPIIASLGVG